MSQAEERFIEAVGRHVEEEGEPRIAGRLFGLLMATAEPCSLDEVAERLRISKGSASSNARVLERWGVAEKVTRPGDRRDFYRISPQMHVRYLERLVVRGQRFLERLREGQAALAGSGPVVGERFRHTIDTQEHALRVLAGALETMRETDRAREPRGG